MDYIRQLRVVGRRSWTQAGTGGSSRPGRRRAACELTGWKPLERRELLSTTQNFTAPGTAYTLQQIGGPPAAMVQSSATGNVLLLATTPTFPAAGNDNSISFVTSDVGTYNQATASWSFRVTPNPGNGVGMSFTLLNTANYGTSGGASTTMPQEGLYNGSVAFGFDTTANTVYLSLNGSIVSAIPLQGLGLTLASGQVITANATIDFIDATVSLSLTPAGGSSVPVFHHDLGPGAGALPISGQPGGQELRDPDRGFRQLRTRQCQRGLLRRSHARDDLVQRELVRCAR